jgi:hypothetical protein
MVFTVALALFPDQAVVIIHLPAALPNSIMEVCGRRCIICELSSHLTICGPVPTRVIYSALQFTAFWDLSSCFYHYSTLWLWNIPDSQSVIIGRCVEASERRE